jgi:hypothetical protein
VGVVAHVSWLRGSGGKGDGRALRTRARAQHALRQLEQRVDRLALQLPLLPHKAEVVHNQHGGAAVLEQLSQRGRDDCRASEGHDAHRHAQLACFRVQRAPNGSAEPADALGLKEARIEPHPAKAGRVQLLERSTRAFGAQSRVGDAHGSEECGVPLQCTAHV